MRRVGKTYGSKVSIAIAVFFLLGVVGMFLPQGGTTYASSNSNIGVIDYTKVLSKSPDMVLLQQTMDAEVAQAQKEYETKAATLTSDQEKRALYDQLQKRVSDKGDQLRKPILDKINAAIKVIADKQGLTTVLDKTAALWGTTDQDITDDVIRKISTK
ncbi:MAG: OmpH family outer membrane protein [Negativicutes bacterium]|nr:OmpH family outer membrane protein [Negativicutes bacterium]